ncbi:transmembrane prolyl 4-hydroxylase-like [Oculina patagonica]
MQVVRYQTFGHYHAHYDSGLDPNVPCCHQNPSLKPPQCRLCRFITILYYLNNVKEGGETAFPVADNSTISLKELENPLSDDFNLSINCHTANLVLPPKKGTAIMWYNNFIDPDSGLLGDLDRYSIHGGCDVIKGEKWIANNWLTAPTKHSSHIKSAYDVGFD